jgi:DNA-binding MarR family transcriptional regulator
MNSKNPPPEAKRVLDSIRRLVQSLRIYSRKTEGHLGLSAAQIFVLQELNEAAHMTLKELAQRTMTDVSSVSVVVERLAQKHLLIRRRAKADARRLDLCISALGKQVLSQKPYAVQSRLIHAVEQLPAPRRKALADDLEELLKSAGMGRERPAMLFEPEGK